MDFIIVGENEDSTWYAKVSERTNKEVASTDYHLALCTARDLLHRNGGGTIIFRDKKNKTTGWEDVK